MLQVYNGPESKDGWNSMESVRLKIFPESKKEKKRTTGKPKSTWLPAVIGLFLHNSHTHTHTPENMWRNQETEPSLRIIYVRTVLTLLKRHKFPPSLMGNINYTTRTRVHTHTRT